MIVKITPKHVDKLLISYGIIFFYFFMNAVFATCGWLFDREKGFGYGYIFGALISFVFWFYKGRTIANRAL
jgi:hypothetical protein